MKPAEHNVMMTVGERPFFSLSGSSNKGSRDAQKAISSSNWDSSVNLRIFFLQLVLVALAASIDALPSTTDRVIPEGMMMQVAFSSMTPIAFISAMAKSGGSKAGCGRNLRQHHRPDHHNRRRRLNPASNPRRHPERKQLCCLGTNPRDFHQGRRGSFSESCGNQARRS